MKFSDRGFPFTRIRLRVLAYQLALENKRTGFSPVKKMAGRYWLKGFLQWHPQLRIKNSKNLSVHRAQCANPGQIDKFFNQFTELLDKFNITYKPNNIWNIDESGLNDVPDEEEVIGIVGKPQMSQVAGEKGVNTTLMTFVSAGGMSTPPMVIFKAAKVLAEWREAAPSGYLVRRSEKGYVNGKLFLEYGERFVQFLKEKRLHQPKEKHLLLLDSHKSHLFNLSFMQCMIRNDIEVMCLPPHCTHLLQPLDDVPFASLKTKWQAALVAFNLKTGARKMTKVDFFRNLIPAYIESISFATIQAGFRNCGIYPVNRNAPKLALTGPSKVTACKFVPVLRLG